MFHVERLRRHKPNDSSLFPAREAGVFYDFGQDPDQEFLVDDIVAHQWNGNSVQYLVQWDDGDLTWESWDTVKDLEAVDRYFKLQGVKHWRQLPKNGHSKTHEARETAARKSTRKQMATEAENAPQSPHRGATTVHTRATSAEDSRGTHGLVTDSRPVIATRNDESTTATQALGRGR